VALPARAGLGPYCFAASPMALDTTAAGQAADTREIQAADTREIQAADTREAEFGPAAPTRPPGWGGGSRETMADILEPSAAN
jgi:hypothetical protein